MPEVTYVMLELKDRYISPCAEVRVDGHYFGHIYPRALSANYSDGKTRFPFCGFTFTYNHVARPATVDIMHDQLDHVIQTLAVGCPPF